MSNETWLYAEVHKASSLDQVLRAVFALEGLPSVDKQSTVGIFDRISNTMLGFLAAYVHQFQHALDLNERRRLSDAQLAAWDLTDEAVQELLVACLLARLRVSAQGVSHLRRSLELMIEGAFLSTSFIQVGSVHWSPFLDIYMTDLWQHYASSKPLTAREVIQAIRADGDSVPEQITSFTTLYLRKFARPYCDKHLQELLETHKLKRLSEPVWHDADAGTGNCASESCSRKAKVVVIERLPNFELMREVAKAKLSRFGYTNAEDESLRSLYARTSGFVHVTREAHRHKPEWDDVALQKWADLLSDLVVWLTRTFTCLYRHHGIELAGLTEFLREAKYNFAAVPPIRVLEVVCRLYSPRERARAET